jgi:hypothetical protein
MFNKNFNHKERRKSGKQKRGVMDFYFVDGVD